MYDYFDNLCTILALALHFQQDWRALMLRSLLEVAMGTPGLRMCQLEYQDSRSRYQDSWPKQQPRYELTIIWREFQDKGPA